MLGRTRTQGRGIIAGSMNDCDGNRVMHAIATVSSTSGEVDMVEDAVTSYFSASEFPGGIGVRTETTESGLFLIPELHESQDPVYLQVWGYPTQGDLDSGELVQLAEVETTVLGDAIITVGADPLRTDASAAN